MHRSSPWRLLAALWLICSVGFLEAAWAERMPVTAPESVGLSGPRLERIATAVDRAI